MKGDAEEIDVEDHEEIVERVAAIDVAKASGKVCTRVPQSSDPAKRLTRVWDVSATTNAITALADQLAADGIERVVVESTSDYWRPFVYLLQARGLNTWLVKARDVKAVPGRPKTDKLDAVWLAKLNERGMLRPSFIPPVEIRRLRGYTRLRTELTEERSRYKQRLEKLLEDALIKLSSVATDFMGVSGRAMIEALIAGERDPQVLAALAKGQLRVKHGALVEALTGQFDDHHAELARILLDQIDALSAQITALTGRITEAISAIPAAQARTVQSGPKNRGAKTGKGNRYLKGILGEAAAAAAKTDTFLGERYRRLVKRRGKLKALVAVARSILVIVWHLLSDPTARFHDLGADFYTTHVDKDRRTRHLVHQLRALGHQVTLTPAA